MAEVGILAADEKAEPIAGQIIQKMPRVPAYSALCKCIEKLDRRPIQAFTRRLEALEHRVTQEKNRLMMTPERFKADIEAHIELLEQQITSVKSECRYIFRHKRRLKSRTSCSRAWPNSGIAASGH
jgi:hypothetical protein